MNELDRSVAVETQEETVDLSLLAKELMKKWRIILIAGFVCAVGAFVGTKLFVKPTYQSNFTAYINNHAQDSGYIGVSGSDVTVSRQLASTCAEIIKSTKVLEEAYKRSNVSDNFSYVKGSVSIGSLNGTEIIRVKVTLDDPQKAYQFACALQEVTMERVSEIVEGSSVKIVGDATYPGGRFAPDYSKNTVYGFVAGFILMTLISLVIILKDNRIKGETEITDRYGLIILGTIHDMSQPDSGVNRYYGYGKRGVGQ